ncbi:polyketide synthase dehydratase domain-containing protein, partial [Burkholderia pseudomallei]
REVLARLALPESVAHADAFVLHPSMMDAAFQIADSLILQPRANGGCLPFFVKELVVRRRPGRDAWVHVRLAGGDATLARYDIDLIDPDGTVCVSMREFSARAETAGGSGRPNTYRAAEWRAAECDGERDGNELSELNELNEGNEGNERRRAAPRVAVLDASPRLAHALRGIGVDALWLPADAAHAARGPALRDLDAALHAGAARDLLVLADERRELDDDALRAWLDGAPHAGGARRALVSIAGLADADARAVADIVERERHGRAADVRYDAGGARSVRGFADAAVARWLLDTDALRSGGVYWIAGANGPLGASLACHLATVERATVVLTDAHAIDAARLACLDGYRAGGARLEFIEGDAARDGAALAQRIRARHGRIDGVLHCAQHASAPTLAALAALDRATRADALDCFVACEARDADP